MNDAYGEKLAELGRATAIELARAVHGPGYTQVDYQRVQRWAREGLDAGRLRVAGHRGRSRILVFNRNR